MANYRVELAATAERSLRKIPKRDLRRVIEALQMLAITPMPTGCRKLSEHGGIFRVRVGVYRIIYEVFRERLIVKVIKIGHRKDVYR
jgi:mRNA interferase RelE/StbE